MSTRLFFKIYFHLWLTRYFFTSVCLSYLSICLSVILNLRYFLCTEPNCKAKLTTEGLLDGELKLRYHHVDLHTHPSDLSSNIGKASWNRNWNLVLSFMLRFKPSQLAQLVWRSKTHISLTFPPKSILTL